VTAPDWAAGPLARSGLLDLRVGRRAAAALRSIAVRAEALAPGRIRLVALHGSRSRGLARRGSDYDLAVVVEGEVPTPGFADDLADACLSHVLDGMPVHAVALTVPAAEGSEALLDDVLRDGIAVTPRARPEPSVRPGRPRPARG
jgi:predicted nucleotidyltransferase